MGRLSAMREACIAPSGPTPPWTEMWQRPDGGQTTRSRRSTPRTASSARITTIWRHCTYVFGPFVPTLFDLFPQLFGQILFPTACLLNKSTTGTPTHAGWVGNNTTTPHPFYKTILASQLALLSTFLVYVLLCYFLLSGGGAEKWDVARWIVLEFFFPKKIGERIFDVRTHSSGIFCSPR